MNRIASPNCRGSRASPAALREPHLPAAAVGGAASRAQEGAARGREAHVCHSTDPALMQEVLVGGAVFGAVSAALIGGLRQEPEVCQSCAGSGGVRCFACEGTGRMSGAAMEELTAAGARRDTLGRNVSKLECRACKGAGLLFCKKCNGNGYR